MISLKDRVRAQESANQQPEDQENTVEFLQVERRWRESRLSRSPGSSKLQLQTCEAGALPSPLGSAY